MTVTKVYCDHCGAELDTMEDYCDLDITANHITINTDLCQECFEMIMDGVHNFCANTGRAEGSKDGEEE